jgi:hypothetical protein
MCKWHMGKKLAISNSVEITINHINFILLVKLNKIMQILVSSLYYPTFAN